AAVEVAQPDARADRDDGWRNLLRPDDDGPLQLALEVHERLHVLVGRLARGNEAEQRGAVPFGDVESGWCGGTFHDSEGSVGCSRRRRCAPSLPRSALESQGYGCVSGMDREAASLSIGTSVRIVQSLLCIPR